MVFTYVYIFVTGIIIGSFLNVCIHRMPKDESIIFPGSHCPQCKKKIKWYDNLPIISYIILLGKCRYCGTRIPFRYPLVELITGLIFVFIYNKYGLTIEGLRILTFVIILFTLSYIDYKSYILPDSLTFLLIILGFIFSALSHIGIERSLIGASVYAFPFFLLCGYGELIFKKEVMGFGDIKLACGIGAYLGYISFFKFYLFFLISFFLGSIISIILIVLKLKSRKDMIPFGPFLALAGIIMMIYL